MEEQLLLKRYKILDVLAEGGFAKVYKAYDTRLERTVAIKQIPISKKTRHRTHREAKTTALLNHPNIVTLHEFEQTEEDFYLIMEFIDGITVEDILRQKSPLSISEAIAIGSQVCLALEFAHLNGVVHRDIKPANLMLLPDGRIKVMDFGIAKLVGAAQTDLPEIAREHELIGTAAYMSPEQVNRELVDETSDIYSLGVVMYELLSGENPFSSDTPRSTFFRILQSEPEPLSELSPQISEELSDVVLKVMDKDPNLRYKNAVEMRYKLERHQPIKQPPEKTLRPLARRLLREGAEREEVFLPSLGLASKIRDLVAGHEEAVARLRVAVPASGFAWFVFGKTFAYPASLSMPLALIAFTITMISPLLGVAATVFAVLLPLAAYSIALSLAALFFAVILIIAVKEPFLILLPLAAPFLAWAQIGFLYPLGVGFLEISPEKIFKLKTALTPFKSRLLSAALAGSFAALGGLVLEISDIFGQQATLRYLGPPNDYRLFEKFAGSADLIELLIQSAQPFIQNPVLLMQILLWGIAGFLVSFLSQRRGLLLKTAAASAGIAILVLGYQSLASLLGLAALPLSGMVQNLSFSSIILLVLIFLFSPRPAWKEEIQAEDETDEEKENEDELA